MHPKHSECPHCGGAIEGKPWAWKKNEYHISEEFDHEIGILLTNCNQYQLRIAKRPTTYHSTYAQVMRELGWQRKYIRSTGETLQHLLAIERENQDFLVKLAKKIPGIIRKQNGDDSNG